MKRSVYLLFVLALFVDINNVKACTDIIVGPGASKDGSVIISHTECGDDCRIRVVEGRKFKEGEQAPVYWGLTEGDRALDDYGELLGYIPQVEETYTYFHSAYSHLNEHQLAIGESTTSQREALKFQRGDGDQIMTIEQAQIFALQRCTQPREAVELMGSLMEEYGFLPSCIGESEALCIGNPEEVWIFEVFSVGVGWKKGQGVPGAIWAARRLPDDHVTIIPNWSIISTIDASDTENYLVCDHYKQFAINKGWYNPDEGKEFSWRDAYAPVPREWATSRFWMFYSTVAPHYAQWPDRSLKSPFSGQHPYVQYVESIDDYPFSVKPDEKLSVEDVRELQRSVFKGTIYDMTSDPDWYVPGKDGKMLLSPLATPFPTKAMRELLDITWRRNVVRTGYGMIAQLRGWLPDPIGAVYWVYMDNQYISPYMPIYAGVSNVSSWLQNYNADEYDEHSARWIFDEVDNLLYLRWQEASKDLEAVRDSLEWRFADRQMAVEAEALALYKKSPRRAKEYLTKISEDYVKESVEAYKALRRKILVKYTNNKQGS